MPIAKEAPAARVSIKGTANRPARASVVLMGHNTDARKAMAAALTSSGYAVREGATVDGVRALVHMEPPDLLVIDLTTASGPEADRECVDLLVALHTDAQTRSIRPVVLIDRAVHSTPSVQLDLLPIRTTILDKPLDASNLRRMLGRFVPRSRGAPLRVLVADDDPLVFKFVTSVLPAHEYVVLHAASGREVLRAVDTQSVDAILLDLRMPDKSGYDVIRSLKLEGRAPDLPILVMTNYPAPADAEEQVLLSSPLILDVLPKPTVAERPELLLERLEAIRSGL